MAVPSNVIERINRLESLRKRTLDWRGGDAQTTAARVAAVALRKKDREVLMEMAKEVFLWRDVVSKSRDGKRLWELIGAGARVFVYADWFWDDLPIEAGNPVQAHTRIFLDGVNHHFLFEEWRVDDAGAIAPYQERSRITSPLDLVDRVHPALVEKLFTHLSGPEAWQGIIDELDVRLNRYVTVEPVRKGA